MKCKRIFAAGAALLLAVVSGACRTTEETRLPADSVSSEPEKAVYYSPLTGEAGCDESSLLNRPVAVMVNNIEQSLPQRGISKADIVYEMPVEGGITRLMAVFSDYHDLPEIGSIRSARHDYVELSLPLDAIYLHFGGSDAAKSAIAKFGVDDIDGLAYSNTAFRFDSESARKKAREHCYFSDAALLLAGIEKKEIRTTLSAPLSPLFDFEETADASMTESALSVSAPMSGICTPIFTYDAASGLYKKGQYGGDHIDETTGEAVKVKNVFLMYTDVSLMSDGLHKEINLASGHGYYFTNGKMQKVTFRKADEQSSIKVLAADGSECKVTPGQTWFCVIPSEFEAKLNISGGEDH